MFASSRGAAIAVFGLRTAEMRLLQNLRVELLPGRREAAECAAKRQGELPRKLKDHEGRGDLLHQIE